MDRPIDDRRRERRFQPAADPVWTVRIRPGHDVAIIDVSPAGALIEGARPLPPGGRIVLRLQRGTDQGATTTARVVRCGVADLRSSAVTYRTALRFETRCAWVSEEQTRDEYQVPGTPASAIFDVGHIVPTTAGPDGSRLPEAVKP